MASVTTTDLLLPSAEHTVFEECRTLSDDQVNDKMMIIAKDENDNELFITIDRLFPDICTSEVYMKLASQNVSYKKTNGKYICSNKWMTDDTQLTLIEPMKIWRIAFNGLLSEASRGTEEKSECHVRFSFLWHPLSSPVFFDKCSNVSFFVQNDSPLTEQMIREGYLGYEQWGMLHGKVYINGKIDIELNMKCLRKRNWKVSYENTLNFVVFSNDSSNFSISSTDKSLKSGHAYTLKRHIILDNPHLQLFSDLHLKYVIIITEKNHKWQIREHTSHNDINSDNAVINVADYMINDNEQALGFRISYTRSDKKLNNCSFPTIDIFPNDFTGTEELYTIDLASDECTDVNLVGGKAASLAKINFLKKHEVIPNFNLINIPSGFSITTHAMNAHLMKNGFLQERLEFLQNQLYTLSRTENDLSYFLERLKMLWVCSDMADNLKNHITHVVDPNKKYAIRSSGILEDNNNFSFAGQNSTYLNVRHVTDIQTAVKSCWASIYSFQSIQYRRENGINILQNMGIIVQEMVEPDVAGVLFTCDPVTSDPRYMVMSYCFGLGEGVVSGRSLPNTLYYLKINKLLMKTKPFASECNQTASIAFSSILIKLCQLCQDFEQVFGSFLDVEWAVSKEVIYILQCRQATTKFSWSDFDIIHEIDSAFTEYDAITFHNCGEIMVGATSPLTLTFVDSLVEQSYLFGVEHPSGTYQRKLLSTVQFRIVLNIFNSLLLDVKERITFDQIVVDTAVCGRVITDEKLYQIARKRNGITSPRTNLYRLYTVLKLYNTTERAVGKANALESNFRIDVDKFKNVLDLFQHISQQAYVLKKVSEYHLVTSSVDNFLKVITLRIMCDGDTDKLKDGMSDMTLALSKSKDVISGDVPYSLQKIANTIVGESAGNKFSDVQPSEGYDWLKNNCIKAYEALSEFLDRHGCRGIKEFDLITETWSMKPAVIIETLQSLIKAEIDSPTNLPKSVDANIVSSNIGSNGRQPSTSGRHIVKRKLINWLLSRCQNVVGYRERTKKSIVVIINQFRMAFRKLSELMFRDNMLPNTNAIFFLTYYELYRIIRFEETHLILNKVMKRQRLWNYIENLDFPHVIIGLPKSVNKHEIGQMIGADQARGFAVTNNSTKGRACVLDSVARANELRRGDILVTKCIDIGWSPYFPMLGGIVTELGGFVSHGAVIAREYGLPCIVSVPDATRIFHTGDVIAIVGSNGIVQKIPTSETGDVINEHSVNDN